MDWLLEEKCIKIGEWKTNRMRTSKMAQGGKALVTPAWAPECDTRNSNVERLCEPTSEFHVYTPWYVHPKREVCPIHKWTIIITIIAKGMFFKIRGDRKDWRKGWGFSNTLCKENEACTGEGSGPQSSFRLCDSGQHAESVPWDGG